MSCWPYYLAWFALVQLLNYPALLAGVLVLFALQRHLPDPWVWVRTAGRIRSLQRAVEVNASNVPARRDLARLYLERGRPRKALELLADARKRAPEQADLLLLTGMAQLRVDEPEAALQAMLAALDGDARVGFGEPYRLAGDALCRLGRFEEAEDAYQHFLDHNSSSLEAWFKIHALRRRAGRRAEARDALLAVQLAQERHRASHPRYADRLEPLDRPATTPSSLYRVRIVHADATSYAIEAKAQGSQASDRRCRVLALRMQAGEIQLTAFDDRGAEQADACWPR